MGSKIPPDEISTFVRRFLTEVFATLTPKTIRLLRDAFDTTADIADAFYKQRKKYKRRLRPPEDWIDGLENGLHEFVGSDLEKWTETKTWMETLLKQWQALAPALEAMLNPAAPSSATEDVTASNRSDLAKSLRILLHGSPGRRPDRQRQQNYAEMNRLRIEKGYSYARLAKKFFPEEFKTHPERVKARIRRGIERLKSRQP